MAKPVRWVIVAALMLSAAGCGGFDPAEHRPCDFIENKELEQYQLKRGVNQDDRCLWIKPELSEDTLDELAIVYLDEPPSAVVTEPCAYVAQDKFGLGELLEKLE